MPKEKHNFSSILDLLEKFFIHEDDVTKNVDVLFSTELPIDLSDNPLEQKLLKQENSVKHQIPGSISFVPSIAGLLIARHIILNLIK